MKKLLLTLFITSFSLSNFTYAGIAESNLMPLSEEVFHNIPIAVNQNVVIVNPNVIQIPLNQANPLQTTITFEDSFKFSGNISFLLWGMASGSRILNGISPKTLLMNKSFQYLIAYLAFKFINNRTNNTELSIFQKLAGAFILKSLRVKSTLPDIWGFSYKPIQEKHEKTLLDQINFFDFSDVFFNFHAYNELGYLTVGLLKYFYNSYFNIDDNIVYSDYIKSNNLECTLDPDGVARCIFKRDKNVSGEDKISGRENKITLDEK